ncbi:unnamed protein product [Prorocentrum cordatum]|uniref:Pentatricopeptide repeat-containing protein n=1 Tax=Prorocentrum cordatum TaxID=2364126 RepID=A0ABN9QW08_9DINO|nr:unnamed protein product [Polarella glacialis]
MREKDWQGRWQRALALLNEMAGVKLEPTIICYSTSISAREGAVAAGVGDDEAKEVAQVDVARAEEEVEEARELETAVWDEGDTKVDAVWTSGMRGRRSTWRCGPLLVLVSPRRYGRMFGGSENFDGGHGRPGLRNLP